MNEQKALDRIKTIRLDGTSTNCYWAYTNSQEPFEEDQAILQELVDLKKPMKVIDDRRFAKNKNYYWICPRCKEFISKAPKHILKVTGTHSFCTLCSQCLDWSETE